ncbi:MAG: hypothetical protein V8S74_07860, partial [Lachnospirales bacterium]
MAYESFLADKELDGSFELMTKAPISSLLAKGPTLQLRKVGKNWTATFLALLDQYAFAGRTRTPTSWLKWNTKTSTAYVTERRNRQNT